jgi:hypothetical protein
VGARAIPPQEIQADLISNLFKKTPVVHRRVFFARFSASIWDTDSTDFPGFSESNSICENLRNLRTSSHSMPGSRIARFFAFSCFWALRGWGRFASFHGAPPRRLSHKPILLFSGGRGFGNQIQYKT